MQPLALLRIYTVALAVVIGGWSAASAAQAINFAVIADYGTTQQSSTDVANLVKSWNPDFIVTGGDNWYGSDAAIDTEIGKHYHPYIYNYQGTYGPGSPVRRFFPALGNHDYRGGNANAYINYFDLPGNERYYSFTQGPVDFFILNSNPEEPDGISSTSRQAQWLQAAMADSDAPWKLVVMHYPPHSSGTPFTGMRWPFKEWGASLVLASHHHAYERLSVNGLTYTVNGLGGAEKHAFDSSPDPNSVIRYNADFGAQRIVADEWSMRLQFVSRGGTVIDDHTLTAPGKYLLAAATTWNNAAAWQPTGVPTAGDSCILRFDDSTPRTITYANTDGNNVNLARLRIDAAGPAPVTLAQSRDTLKTNLLENATLRSSFTQNGGTLDAQRIVNRGTIIHTAGTFRITASLRNEGGAVSIGPGAQWGPGAILENTSGTINLNATQHIPVINITGGIVKIPQGTTTLITNSLSITGQGKLDAGASTLIIKSTSLDAVRSMLAQGRGAPPGGVADGQWNGASGLTSAVAASHNASAQQEQRVLAYALNGELLNPYQTFAGQPITPNDILIRFTSNADANLDGIVNNNDITILAGFYRPGTFGRHWHQADFNYDGQVNNNDITILAGFYSPASPPISSPASLSVVPEPPIGGIAVLLSNALLTRPRRRRPPSDLFAPRQG